MLLALALPLLLPPPPPLLLTTATAPPGDVGVEGAEVGAAEEERIEVVPVDDAGVDGGARRMDELALAV